MPLSPPTPQEIKTAAEVITKQEPGAQFDAYIAAIQPAAEEWSHYIANRFGIAAVAHNNPIFLSAIAFGLDLGLRIGRTRHLSIGKARTVRTLHRPNEQKKQQSPNPTSSKTLQNQDN